MNEEIMHIQKLLNRHGYSVLVDGEYGERTKDAVAAFQGARGLYATGLIDSETLDALEV